MYVLSFVDITFFISALVALGQRFNAASKKEKNTEGMTIYFFTKSFLKSISSLIDPLVKRMKLLI